MKKNALILTAALLIATTAFAGCASTNASRSSGTASVAAQTSSPSASASSAAASSLSPVSSPATRVFTLSELKQYNGRNGKPAYIAVSGVVYDVTNVSAWSGGTHHGYSAGQDLTQAIQYAPHGTSVLQNLPVVGKLKQ